MLRAVKTPSEIAKLAAAEALNDRIWGQTLKEFRPGMTEKDMQRIIRARMNALGDGEAFETIVCVGPMPPNVTMSLMIPCGGRVSLSLWTWGLSLMAIVPI